MMSRQLIILQLLFTLGFKSCVAEYGQLKCSCEPVPAAICASQYNDTTFPNKVNGFSSGEDALKEFQSFPIGSLVLHTCSSMLVNFICSYYFPPCLRDLDCKAIGPCDSLCEQVRLGCEPLLLKNNYTWPDRLDCSKFPSSKSADPYCIPAMPPITVTVEAPCVKVEQPICASLHPNYMTRFPNKGLITQQEANVQFASFIPALNSNCSSMLKALLCTSHYPVCAKLGGSMQIYPCKHMCEEVKTNCEPFLLQNNQSWPEFLNCSNFPNKSKSACVDSTFTAPTTSTPTPTLGVATLPSMPDRDTCEPLLPEVLEICGGIHPNYTMTHFPHGNFASQKQAIEKIKTSTEYSTYLKLIDQNCAAELKPFLCLHFFPLCTPTHPITLVKPCRNVCRKAKNGCSPCLKEFEWHFNCDDYPVHGACLNREKDLKHYLRKLSSTETKC